MSVEEKKMLAKVCLPNKTVFDWSLARVFYMILKTYSESGCRGEVIISGLGADEIFGGYARHKCSNLKDCLSKDLKRIGKRNGGRDDRIAVKIGVKMNFPFLDKELVDFAMQSVPDEYKIPNDGRNVNKLILRRALEKFLLWIS